MDFDLDDDERPIFLAESDEQLQLLDEGFVRLEREANNPELLQTIFRAAHTLKGSAGAIGHRRMAEVTHRLEAVLDGLRKGTLRVRPEMVDVCLESLDTLRALLGEVIQGAESNIDVSPLVGRLAALAAAPETVAAFAAPADQPIVQEAVLTRPGPANTNTRRSAGDKPNGHGSKTPATNGHKASSRMAGKGEGSQGPMPHMKRPTQAAPPQAAAPGRGALALSPASASAAPTVHVSAVIDPNSIASAARALQLMLALQDIGQITAMSPDQAAIEAGTSASSFAADVTTSSSPAEVYRALRHISEIEQVMVDGQSFSEPPQAEPGPGPTAVEQAEDAGLQRLGEYLVSNGLLTTEQLRLAVREQAANGGSNLLFGQRLVKLGLITQSQLDAGLAQQISDLRTALQAAPVNNGQPKNRGQERTVRTSVERLDSLMNLVGELITDRNRLYQVRSDLELRNQGNEQVDQLAQVALHLGRITHQLQEEVMRIRMLPIANVFHKFPRLVRDLCRKAGKEVDLVIRGEDTELDRTVIEEISDPLLHLLRNSVDHGLETPDERRQAGKPTRGQILLAARHEESRIILTVEDDGRGIDLQAVRASALRKGLISEAEAATLTDDETVQLIFKPGLSTAKVVTDISGRGVGMDIVRANLDRLGGTISVDTRLGQGTRFEVALPLTLAIIPALLVHIAGSQRRPARSTFAVPLASVLEAVRVAASDIHTINQRPVVLLRGRVLPLLRLDEVLGGAEPSAARRPRWEYIVAVRWAKLEMGLVVDALIGEQDLVIKSLGPLLGEAPGVSGAAILGDGRVALIMDVPGLFRLAGV